MHQFCELLPEVKCDFDSLEGDVAEFETIGSDSAVLDQVASTCTRIEALECGIRSIADNVRQIRPSSEQH